jgi:hypothetical protein
MPIVTNSDPEGKSEYLLWRIFIANLVLEHLKSTYQQLTPEQRREIRACLREQ